MNLDSLKKMNRTPEGTPYGGEVIKTLNPAFKNLKISYTIWAIIIPIFKYTLPVTNLV
jgi:hypothetical protein